MIEECTRLSFEDKMGFPEGVKRLLAVGIERYYADMVQVSKTYYDAKGGVYEEDLPLKAAGLPKHRLRA